MWQSFATRRISGFIQEIEVAHNTEAETVEFVIPADTPFGSFMARTAVSGNSDVEFEIRYCERLPVACAGTNVSMNSTPAIAQCYQL